jgi:flavorubredoxin
MGAKALKEHFQLSRDITVVNDGEILSLGSTELAFMETRMLHWPDSMFTYFQQDDILFSQDAFGSHLATSERFDDEIDLEILELEAAKYFANILMPYTPLITKLLDKTENIGLKPGMIVPDHGPLWRTNIDRILQLYRQWSAMKSTKKAVVLYDTMWQSTAKMANAIGDGLTAGGAKATLMPLSACHRSDVATEILDAGALIVGSPTLNNNLFPTVADALTYMQGLKPQNLIGAAFGSYGWNEAAVRKIEEILSSMKIDLVSDSVTVKYVPNNDDLKRCHDLGKLMAEKLLEQSQ